MYQYGRGVPKDYKEAVRWYRKAAAQGNEKGQKHLKRDELQSAIKAIEEAERLAETEWEKQRVAREKGVIVRAVDLELITLEPESRNDDNSRTMAQRLGRPFQWLGWIDGRSGGAAQRTRFLRLRLGLGLAQRLPK